MKCDERKPFCLACEKAQVKCEGYYVPKAWIFEPNSAKETSESPEPAIKQDSNHKIVVSNGSTILTKLELGSSFLRPPLSNRDLEASTLMKCYVDYITGCPMSWEGELFQPKKPPPFIDDTGTLIIRTTDRLRPIRQRGHLALAAAALHLFEPSHYPPQLHIKYLQLAVVEIRKHISRSSFIIDDLVQGIAKVFLATTLHGDEVSARAHLSAAMHLVNQAGGLDAIPPAASAALRYGDLHLAVETVSPLTFALPFNFSELQYSPQCPIDATLARLSQAILASTKSHNFPSMLHQAIRAFVSSALCLADMWSSTLPGPVTIAHLGSIGPRLAVPVALVLGAQRQLEATHAPSPPTAKLLPKNNDFAFSVILVLWIQLLMCCANSSVFTVETGTLKVSVRSNVVPVLSQAGKISSAKFTSLPGHIKQGLQVWNTAIYQSRKFPEVRNDWVELVDVIEEMERGAPVEIAAFFRRLLELRQRRIVITPLSEPASWLFERQKPKIEEYEVLPTKGISINGLMQNGNIG